MSPLLRKGQKTGAIKFKSHELSDATRCASENLVGFLPFAPWATHIFKICARDKNLKEKRKNIQKTNKKPQSEVLKELRPPFITKIDKRNADEMRELQN